MTWKSPLLAVLLTLTTMSPRAQGERAPLMDESTRQKIAEDLEQKVSAVFNDPAGPGCAVLVRMEGETIFARGFGVTRTENGEPITPETNFRLASMTKQFTAAAALRLVEQGKLRLDESLQDILPDFPDYGAAIEVRHLLGHTSGLPDYEDLMPPDTTEQILDSGVLEILKAQEAGDFPPGERYAYSNSGYSALAMIVEARSGKRFADFLRDEFFLPLGMNDTVAFEKGRSEVVRRAYGHRPDGDGGYEFSDQSTTSAVLGDGGIYTSVTDFAKWADAWFAGEVLSPDLQELAWSPGKLNDGTTTDEYGYGWRLDTIEGEKVVGHTGTTRGFNNCGQLVPSRELCVVLLSNRNGEEPARLVPEIVGLVLRATSPRQPAEATQ